MRQGAGGSCNCFGRLHATPIGWSLLARNAVLFLASATVAVTSKAGNLSRLGHDVGQDEMVVLLAAATLVVGVLSGALLYRRAAASAAPGQDAGAGAADDRRRRLQLRQYYPTLEGKGSPLADFFPGATNALLVFVDPQCGPCRMLLPVLERLSGSFQEMHLLVVTRGSADTIREVMGRLPAGRVVIDTDGALATQAAVPGTPSAVVVALPAATVMSVAVGLADIEALLALGPTAEPARRQIALDGSTPGGLRLLSESGLDRALTFSRRDALAAIGTGAGLLAIVGAGGTADAASLSSGGAKITTGCPTCGECTICDMTTASLASRKDTSCRPCSQACSTHKLCEQYANKYAPYTTIQSYLHEHGYRPSGQAKALGLQYNGTLEVFGTYLEFQGATASEGAMLFYGLTNNGQTAVATIFDKPKHVSSVVGTSPSGTVVLQEVPEAQAASTTKTSSVVGDSPENAVAFPGDSVAAATRLPQEGWQCSDYCGYIASAVLALPFFVAAPEALAGLVEGAIMNEILLNAGGQVASYTIAAATQSSQIANVLWALGPGAVTTSLCVSVVCPLLETKFSYCCNYGCDCYDKDLVCLAHCPKVGLAHPDATCYGYVYRDKAWHQFSGVPTDCKPPANG